MQIGAAHLKMTMEEVFKAVTINGAKAVCREKEIGSLEVGKQADIAVFDVHNAEYMLYHFGVNHTDSVYKAGKLVYQRKEGKMKLEDMTLTQFLRSEERRVGK